MLVQMESQKWGRLSNTPLSGLDTAQKLKFFIDEFNLATIPCHDDPHLAEPSSQNLIADKQTPQEPQWIKLNHDGSQSTPSYHG